MHGLHLADAQKEHQLKTVIEEIRAIVIIIINPRIFPF